MGGEIFQRLKEKVSETTTRPGVYLHKDQENKVLYVGKAKNLQKRLRNYFSNLSSHSSKTQNLVKNIVDFEVMVTKDEWEALLLESKLIKEYKPKYNILLRDDKAYPFICLTMHEEFPRLEEVRRQKKEGMYFGPFAFPGQARRLLGVLGRVFPLRKCTLSQMKKVSRPCSYYDLGQCLAPCCKDVSLEEYQFWVQGTLSVLEGKVDLLCEKLENLMYKASEDMFFEQAAKYRDQIQALKRLSDQQQKIENILLPDGFIFSFYFQNDSFLLNVGILKNHQILGWLPFFEENAIIEEDSLSLFLCHIIERYKDSEKINYMICSNISLEDDIKFFEKYLHEFLKAEGFCLNHEEKFLSLKESFIKQSQNIWGEMTLKKESFLKEHFELAQILEQEYIPQSIECYDCSTLQGFATVASRVWFENGKALKKNYRKYEIRDWLGQNDFASMNEVLRRRLARVEEEPLGDILLIDGGEPQLRAVLPVWQALEEKARQKTRLIGIAKERNRKGKKYQERLVILEEKGKKVYYRTFILSLGSPAFLLVTRVRDEAHRFAISYHRQKRDSQTMSS